MSQPAASPVVASVTLDPSLMAKLQSSPNLDVKQWINAMMHHVRKSNELDSHPTEQQVGQLVTKLQLHQQETSTALEDLITQAVVRLPRVAMEVERMAAESTELCTTLTANASRARAVVESAPKESAQLSRLRRTREKLVHCAKILQRAKLLSIQVEDLERAARIGPTASPSKPSEGSASNVADIETVANAVAEVQSSLKEIQEVDPTFGAEMEPRLRTLEVELQRNVEKECFDLMKRLDVLQAPKLLAALRKIHREGHVMQQYFSYIAANRRTQAATELRSSDSAVHKTASADGAAALVFSQFYRNLGKNFAKDVAFLQSLLVVDEKNNEDFDSTACELAKKVASATVEAVSEKLRSLTTNDELVKCYHAAQHDVVKGFESALNGKSHILEDFTRVLFQPYEAVTHGFVQREQHINEATLAAVVSALQDDVAFKGQLRSTVDVLIASLDRAAVFFPLSTLPTVVDGVVSGLIRLLQAVGTPATVPVTGSSTRTTTPQEAFHRFHTFCVVWRSLSSICDPSNGWIASAGSRASLTSIAEKLAKASEMLTGAHSTIKSECIQTVCSSMHSPFITMLRQYASSSLWSQHSPQATKGLAVYNAGQVAPSDIIRQLGAELMELPMTLDSVEGCMPDDAAAEGEAPEWLGCIVQSVVNAFIQTMKSLVLHPRSLKGGDDSTKSLQPALEQLICDVEYFANVLTAVSESTYEDSLKVVMGTVQELLEKEKLQPSATPLVLAAALSK